MPKINMPSFVVTRRIYTEPWQADFIDKKMDLANRIYNNAVRYLKPAVEELRRDAWFVKNLALWRACGDSNEKLKKQYAEEIGLCIRAYGLAEYDIHAFMGCGKQQSFPDGLGINIVQKLGTALYRSIRKALFSGTEIHFRKHGQTCSLEDKKASSGIIYKAKTDSVSFMGLKLRLKPVRKTDRYMMEAMCGRIKYCRIVREAIHGKYRYFLQLVMEGTAPEKLVPGKGTGGLDPGVSTMAFVSDKKAGFYVLAEGVEKYEHAIRDAATKYERRRRLANPQNYNPDGTVKRDTKTFKKHWNRTKGMQKALMELKSEYRKKSVFIKNRHGYLSNRIVESCHILYKEPMDYRALAKRAKDLAGQDKESAVKKKDGTTAIVHKYKRKKRFGSSIGRRAPASFVKMLETKIRKCGGLVVNVDPAAFKASQYDHVSDTYKKPALSDRVKEVGGYMVQRDLYSAFLLSNAAGPERPDRDRCLKEFGRFLELQDGAMFDVMMAGDSTKNFGLMFFLSVHPAESAA